MPSVNRSMVNKIGISLLLSGMFFLAGCYLFKKHQVNQRTGLIIRESINFDRLGSEVSARLSFQTTQPVLCRFQIWSQNSNTEPSEANPRTHNCQQNSPKADFLETVPDLRTDTFYIVEIIAWPVAMGEGLADRAVVSENLAKSLGNELYVVDLNSPMRQAEVHLYQTKNSLDVGDVSQSLRLKTGCATENPLKALEVYSPAAASNVGTIKTYGFATTQSQKHPIFQDRLRLQFNALLNSERWTWQTDLPNQQEFITLPASQIIEASVTSPEKVDLTNAVLGAPSQTVRLGDGGNLTVTWAADNMASASFVVTEFLQPKKSTKFYCTFPANKDEAKISYGELFASSGLAKEPMEVFVHLYGAQLQVFPKSDKKPWLIKNYDWRSFKLIPI